MTVKAHGSLPPLGALVFCKVFPGISRLILDVPLVLFARHELENIRALPHPQAHGAVAGEDAARRPEALWNRGIFNF